ncbi:MAG: hypothetical protein WC551_01680 [Patescibacteria group bacterium]
MTARRSRLRTAAEVVFIGLPCALLFHLWAMAMAEQFKPEKRVAE